MTEYSLKEPSKEIVADLSNNNSEIFLSGPQRRQFLCRECVFSKINHCVDTRAQAKTCGTLIIGGAGCGKTAVCQEIALPTRQSGKQHRLHENCIAKHFCTAQNIDSLNLPRFVLSLHHQILTCGAPFVDAYRAAIQDQEIAELFAPKHICAAPDDAFKRGILLPLLSVPPSKTNCSIVVDSIDESCFLFNPSESGKQQGSKNIAELLSTHHQFFPSWLALVCTCRKQTKSIIRLFTGFRKISLDDLRKSHVIRDVQQYILARLDNEEVLRRNLTQETADMLNLLHIKSNGCILYLETVMDGLSDGFVTPREIADIPGTLNGLYLWLCNRLFSKRHFHIVRPIFNILLASHKPLSEQDLFCALWMQDTTLEISVFQYRISLMERVLRSFNPTARVRTKGLSLFHHSFAEWLMDVKHCTPTYLCSAQEGHTLLALSLTRRGPYLDKSEVRLLAHHITRSCLQAPVKPYHFVLWLVNSGASLEAFQSLESCNDDCDFILDHWNLDLTTERLLSAAGTSVLDDDINPSLSPSHLDCVRAYILPQGPNNGTNNGGAPKSVGLPAKSTLCTSSYQGNTSVVALLLSQGIDVEIRDRNGSTPLILASRQGHSEVVQLLVKAGARLDHIDKDGWSAIRSAAWGGHKSE